MSTPLFQPTETIVALATPMGRAGVAVIRLSGPSSLQIGRQLAPKLPIEAEARHVYYVKFECGNHHLDDGCFIYFEAPRSFTGEDVVEFHTHSSPVAIRLMMNALLEKGARVAEPGEFSKRAFMNGKMDLTQAESMIDLIESKSEKAHEIALNRVQGTLYHHMMPIRHELMRILEQVEGAIDFPDEVEPIDRNQTQESLEAILRDLNNMLTIQDYGQIITHGVRCVIVGKPNVGKSSLFNQLVGENRAIVTSIPGTTRDFLSTSVEIGGVEFLFIDSAGFRKTTDQVEKKGITKIRELLKTAHVLLWVVDGSQKLDNDDERLYRLLVKQALPIYVLLNKSDKKTHRFFSGKTRISSLPQLKISAKTGSGIQELKSRLHETYVQKIESVDLTLMCNARQLHCLKLVQSHLAAVLRTLNSKFEDDVLAIDLRHAVQAISELTGDALTESVLDGIFARFCVGK